MCVSFLFSSHLLLSLSLRKRFPEISFGLIECFSVDLSDYKNNSHDPSSMKMMKMMMDKVPAGRQGMEKEMGALMLLLTVSLIFDLFYVSKTLSQLSLSLLITLLLMNLMNSIEQASKLHVWLGYPHGWWTPQHRSWMLLSECKKALGFDLCHLQSCLFFF